MKHRYPPLLKDLAVPSSTYLRILVRDAAKSSRASLLAAEARINPDHSGEEEGGCGLFVRKRETHTRTRERRVGRGLIPIAVVSPGHLPSIPRVLSLALYAGERERAKREII